jgi:hypothetical protein
LTLRAFAVFAVVVPGLVVEVAALAAGLGDATPAVFGIEAAGPPTVGAGACVATVPPFGAMPLLGPPTAGVDFAAAAPPTAELGLGALPADVPFVPAAAPNETSANMAAMAIIFDTLCLRE